MAPEAATRSRDRAQSKPADRAPKFLPRADGGFGPVGSVPGGGSGHAPYARGAMRWDADGDDLPEERNEVAEFRNGDAYRPGENQDSAVPQFLVEADDSLDDEDAQGRLAAPPVLGESAVSYRDF